MKKKIVSHILSLLFVFSIIIGTAQTTFADASKINYMLLPILESMSDDDLIAVGIEFDQHINPEEVQKRIEDVSGEEERYQIILSIYEEKITDFVDRYYQNDEEKIYYIKPEYFLMVAGATKAQILQFSEEEAVVYLTYAGEYVEVERPTGPVLPGGEEAILLETKAAAIASITGYVDLSDYRWEQQEEIRLIITEAIENINYAPSVDRVQKIISDSEKRLDEVKSDEQLTKKEKPTVTPTKTPKPTVVPPNSESKPTVTPSENEPKPTMVPSKTEQKPTVTPSKSEAVPIVIPPKTDSEPTVSAQVKESTIVPTVTPQEKVSLTNEAEELGRVESEKPESDRTLETIVLIAVTAIVLAIVWLVVQKRKQH